MDQRLVLSADTFNCVNETFSDTKPNVSEDTYSNKQRVKIHKKMYAQKHMYLLASCEETPKLLRVVFT